MYMYIGLKVCSVDIDSHVSKYAYGDIEWKSNTGQYEYEVIINEFNESDDYGVIFIGMYCYVMCIYVHLHNSYVLYPISNVSTGSWGFYFVI
jgi:hypothetical protein